MSGWNDVTIHSSVWALRLGMVPIIEVRSMPDLIAHVHFHSETPGCACRGWLMMVFWRARKLAAPRMQWVVLPKPKCLTFGGWRTPWQTLSRRPLPTSPQGKPPCKDQLQRGDAPKIMAIMGVNNTRVLVEHLDSVLNAVWTLQSFHRRGYGFVLILIWGPG